METGHGPWVPHKEPVSTSGQQKESLYAGMSAWS